MTRTLLSVAALAALATPAFAQQAADAPPSPNQIVEQAAAEEWVRIAPEDLLVMTLASDADGNERTVVIQLMPPPFSQGWVENIRTLARAGWYDDITVNRVQDNYVVQWGDANYDNPEATGEAKPLPEGLRVMGEKDYLVDVMTLSEAASEANFVDTTESEETKFVVVMEAAEQGFAKPDLSDEDREKLLQALLSGIGLDPARMNEMTENEEIAMISIKATQTPTAPEGWHQRDSYAEWVEFFRGWPIANHEERQWFDPQDNPIPYLPMPRHEAYPLGYYQDEGESHFWPVHCYGMVGVGRGYSPDTGSGAELYTVIGHAPRHLDRNIALVGRVVEGIEYLSSLPRGKGQLGFYEDAEQRTPILTVRVASDLPSSEQPSFEYLSTEGETFARYAEARANRRDPFFIVPAGGADICNIPVPVRRVGE